jgi:hypothetical protein
MSLLNARLNAFSIWFPKDFFYPEIRERWTPVVKRLKLQYQSLEDYFNATVQAVTFPEVILNPSVQPQTMYKIRYRQGRELEPILDKNITVTFKLVEGFITYWMLFDQIELFQKYQDTSPFWPSMYVSFLDHHGFELVNFEFQKIVPNSLSTFNVSYATVGAEFNTFTLNLLYNRYKISRRLTTEIDNTGNTISDT